jgi:hypothetical protein
MIDLIHSVNGYGMLACCGCLASLRLWCALKCPPELKMSSPLARLDFFLHFHFPFRIPHSNVLYFETGYLQCNSPVRVYCLQSRIPTIGALHCSPAYTPLAISLNIFLLPNPIKPAMSPLPWQVNDLSCETWAVPRADILGAVVLSSYIVLT